MGWSVWAALALAPAVDRLAGWGWRRQVGL